MWARVRLRTKISGHTLNHLTVSKSLHHPSIRPVTATMIFRANIQHHSVWMRECSINFTVWLPPTTPYLELLSIRAISGYPRGHAPIHPRIIRRIPFLASALYVSVKCDARDAN